MSIAETEIEDAILSGWKSVRNFNMLSVDGEAVAYKPEYAISTSIALAIVERNISSGFPHKVVLEQQTRSAFENCFPPYVISAKGLTALIQSRKSCNSARNGRFDICISSEALNYAYPETKFVIEVKEFSPNRKDLKDDILRIHEISSLMLPGQTSSFVCGYLTFAIDATSTIYLNEKERLLELNRMLKNS